MSSPAPRKGVRSRRKAARPVKPETACRDPRPFSRSSSGFRRCDKCDGCKAYKREKKQKGWKKRIAAELGYAYRGSYWIMLSASDEKMADFEANYADHLEAFIKRLKLGRVRSRRWDGFTSDGLYKIDPDPLPDIPKPRTADKRREAGFIEPQSHLAYLWITERSASGRFHIHMLLHPHPDTPLPPGAVAEAWPLGWVGVKPCGTTKKDANNIAFYLSKYLSKDAEVLHRPSNGYGKTPKFNAREKEFQRKFTEEYHAAAPL